MIQLKHTHKHIKGTEAFWGKLVIKTKLSPIGDDMLRADSTDELHVGDVIHPIQLREKIFSMEQYVHASLHVHENEDLTGLNEFQIIDKVVAFHSLHMITTDLFPDGHTSFGYLPEDWEFFKSEENAE